MNSIAFERNSQRAETRMRFHNVTWEQFKAVQSHLERHGGGRVSYLDGAIELNTLTLEHECRKKLVGGLLELFLDEEQIPFFHHGSATLEKKSKQAAKEPDESYCFHEQNKARPDLAIEVAISRSGIDVLEIYRRWRVPEVWRWHKSRLEIFTLEKDRYIPAPRCRWFPKLDIARLEECARMDNAFEARKAFRASLRQRK